MNPFEDYSKRANTIVNQPAKLIGPAKTRADAKERYAEIVTALEGFTDSEHLEVYLISISKDILQFEIELPFYWEGEDDFLGLEKEIERARVRLDDGLDYPRYEVKQDCETELHIEKGLVR